MKSIVDSLLEKPDLHSEETKKNKGKKQTNKKTSLSSIMVMNVN